MLYKALKGFSGVITMSKGEIKEIKDQDVANDLLNAKYIEQIKATPKAANKKKAPKG